MAIPKQKSKRKQALKILHKPIASSDEFYVSEETTSYGNKKPSQLPSEGMPFI
jgi:hypothetical protein